MENPVVTSLSPHHLRSAVGACSKPSNSYRGPGCVKKANDSPFLDNISKKRNTTDDYDSYRKNKNLGNKDSQTQSYATKAKKLNGIKNEYKDVVYKNYNSFYGLYNSRLNPPSFKSKSFDKCSSVITEDDSNVKPIQKVLINDVNDCESLRNGFNKTTLNSVTANATSAVNPSSNNKNNDDENAVAGDGGTGPKKDDVFCADSVNLNTRDNISISSDSDKPELKFISVSDGGKKEVVIDDLVRPPNHSITRRKLKILREARKAWLARFGTAVYITKRQIQLLMKDFYRRFSNLQVYKNLEGVGRGTPMRVSFEEFCSLVLKEYTWMKCDAGIPRVSQSPRHVAKDGSQQQIKKNKKSLNNIYKYEVFLGGSCNPTTWRNEIAIPDLKRMGITYFNPVSQWKPDLMEVEFKAKENASVMFFVLDNQTRGISTLIEVAHIAGCRRQLVLVNQCYPQKERTICGEVLSPEECKDLRNSQEVLQSLVKSQGIPVFDNIKLALECTEKILKENLTVQEVHMKESTRQPTSSSDLYGESITSEEAFSVLDTSETGEITFSDCLGALELTIGKRISSAMLKKVAEEFGDCEEQKINFEKFCQLVTALKTAQEDEESLQEYLSKLPGQDQCLWKRDVYLGGTSKNTSWRNQIAEPLLKKNGVSFFQTNPKTFEGVQHFLYIEEFLMRSSHILLFVITNTARSIIEMSIAGHYIGLGRKVVLCVEHFAADAVVDGDKLSENAIKDYNRGRAYLADVAKRNGVPVFNDVGKAVNYVVEQCRKR